MISERQKEILKVLEEQVEWIASAKLGKIIGCSYKTIQSDIKPLGKLLPQGWEIEKSRGKGLKLKKPLDEGVNIELRGTNEDQLEYGIVKLLTSGEEYTIQSLSDKIYFSSRTVQSLLQKIEDNLRIYQLKLNRRPLEIRGPEVLIRLYLYKLGKKILGEYQLLKATYKDHDYYVKTIKSFEKHLGITFYPQPLVNLIFFLDTSISRIKAGYHTEINPSSEKVTKVELYRKLAPFFDLLETEFDIQINDSERALLFIAFVNTDFTYTEIIEHPQKTLSYLNDNHKKHESLFEFISFFEKELHLPLLASDTFVLSIYDFYQKIKLRSLDKRFAYTVNQDPSISISYLFPETYQKVEIAFTKWKSTNNSSYLMVHDISTLTILFERFIAESGIYKKRVLVVSSLTYMFSQLTVAILNREFQGHIDLISQDSDTISKEEVQKLAIDLVISDTPLDDLDIKTILINKVPTHRDLTNIRKVIS
ncbi:BglG family transcription antiterminator [Sporosarcina limicola]|uniref:Biotin operon repressor n=1 Tax=Sporosarcina limicola TaxID=34101 RepID=A0A927R3M5_9BACL|nr:helix-turn-helix domain-containing protein [Sporosarcina limicola]MBE1555271.1 biotin operon repressor [Sporosarcina limicola]